MPNIDLIASYLIMLGIWAGIALGIRDLRNRQSGRQWWVSVAVLLSGSLVGAAALVWIGFSPIDSPMGALRAFNVAATFLVTALAVTSAVGRLGPRTRRIPGTISGLFVEMVFAYMVLGGFSYIKAGA